MRKLFFYTVAFLLLISCKKKDPIEVRQISTREMVTIEGSYIDKITLKKCFLLSIPTEFEITINYPFNYISWNYHSQYKVLNKDYWDYQVYYKQYKTKEIFTIEPIENAETFLSCTKLISLIVKDKKHLISKKDANDLLKRYKINKCLDDFKSGDIIRLAPFDRFIEENVELINGFDKTSDIIHFKAERREIKSFYVQKNIDLYFYELE